MFDVTTMVTVYEPSADLLAKFEGDLPDAWIRIDGMDLWPETIARIREVLAFEDDELPEELIDIKPNPRIPAGRAAIQHKRFIKAVPPEAWDLALTPRWEFDDTDEDTAHRLQLRRYALEVARRYFTRAVKNVYGSIAMHITDQTGQFKYR